MQSCDGKLNEPAYHHQGVRTEAQPQTVPNLGLAGLCLNADNRAFRNLALDKHLATSAPAKLEPECSTWNNRAA